MRTVALVVSVIGILLGGLWLLQGLGLVHVRPLLCFANCEPVQGPSTSWAAAGFLVVAAGCLGIFYALRHRAPG